MRLTEYFYYLETGSLKNFTHLSFSPAMQKQRALIGKEKRKEAKEKTKQIDLFEDL